MTLLVFKFNFRNFLKFHVVCVRKYAQRAQNIDKDEYSV